MLCNIKFPPEILESLNKTGLNFGNSDFTASVRLGDSLRLGHCGSTSWSSDTSLQCTSGFGHELDFGIPMSFPRRIVCDRRPAVRVLELSREEPSNGQKAHAGHVSVHMPLHMCVLVCIRNTSWSSDMPLQCTLGYGYNEGQHACV